jgi:hypothetical protein
MLNFLEETFHRLLDDVQTDKHRLAILSPSICLDFCIDMIMVVLSARFPPQTASKQSPAKQAWA